MLHESALFPKDIRTNESKTVGTVPMEAVSRLLGHESIKTTERHYAKRVKGRQDRLKKLVTATWK